MFGSRVGFSGSGPADRIQCIFQFDRTHDGGNDMTWYDVTWGKISTRSEWCRLLPNYFVPCIVYLYVNLLISLFVWGLIYFVIFSVSLITSHSLIISLIVCFNEYTVNLLFIIFFTRYNSIYLYLCLFVLRFCIPYLGYLLPVVGCCTKVWMKISWRYSSSEVVASR